MKAAVVYGINDIRYEDIEEPKLKEGYVKIKVMISGICGSDIPRVLQGKCHSFPQVLGHEFSGVICDIGNKVKRLAIGDHVVGAPLVPCMKCNDCKSGNYSLCKNYSFIGSRQQGSFAEYVVVPEINAVKIDKSIPFEKAAMFEPATVALHGVFLNDYHDNHTVLILGCGTIGLFTLQWCRIMGASKIVVIGRNKERLELAMKMGADEVYSTLDEDFQEKCISSNTELFDYVFESAGSISTMKLSFKLAANKSKICFIGTPKENLVFTPELWENLNRKEFNLTGSWMSYSYPFPGREWEMTADNLSNGRLKIHEDMIYKIYPLEQIKEAFDNYLNDSCVKGRILLKI